MTDSSFRVLIAGGSIAGLSLALALERHGIDFLVLESYPKIAAQVGASIAILPNGFRILDQLGCYEDIMSFVNCTIDNFIVRDSDGKKLIHVERLEEHLIERHGYPMIFFERRMLVEVLYNHIRQKDKVLTSKQVSLISQDEDGVAVECKDGSLYQGNILVGADGVHSTVGRHFTQASGERKQELPVEYRCLFGISSKVPGIDEDTLHHVSNYGSSLFAASGPNDRTYWCLFTELGKIYQGSDVPSYDKDDEAETVRAHTNDAVTETVSFGDLYKSKIMSVSTPLHEGVLDKWHHGRSIVIGDAAHKMNPIIGLGGMSALETTTVLTNNIVQLLKTTPIPSTTELEAIFANTQKIRHPRAKAMVNGSTLLQHRFAMTTPFLTFINRWFFPAMGPRSALRLLSDAYPGAASFAGLPHRPESETQREKAKSLPGWLPKATSGRALPFEDELVAPPRPKSAVMVALITVLLFLSVSGLRLRQVHEPSTGGVGHFLAFELPVSVVMLVEGNRKRNTWSLIWSPSSWILATQLLGLAPVLPLYMIGFLQTSSSTVYWMPAERFVPLQHSRASLVAVPLVVFCAAITQIYMGTDAYLWHFVPVVMAVAVEGLARFLNSWTVAKTGHEPLEDYQRRDVNSLQQLYSLVMVSAAAAHVYQIAALAPWKLLQSVELRNFAYAVDKMKGWCSSREMLLVSTSVLIMCLMVVYELKRVGLTERSAARRGLFALVGGVLFGPGAVLMASWRLMENTVTLGPKSQ